MTNTSSTRNILLSIISVIAPSRILFCFVQIFRILKLYRRHNLHSVSTESFKRNNRIHQYQYHTNINFLDRNQQHFLDVSDTKLVNNCDMIDPILINIQTKIIENLPIRNFFGFLSAMISTAMQNTTPFDSSPISFTTWQTNRFETTWQSSKFTFFSSKKFNVILAKQRLLKF